MPNEIQTTVSNLPELEDKARHFRDEALSDSTRRMYSRDWKAFVEFCEDKGIPALPTTPTIVCAYLANLAEHKSVSTVTRALTSINKAQEVAGHDSIRVPLVSATLKGIRREKGTSPTKAKGISYSEIIKMANRCEPSVIGTRDKAILLIGWMSALRRSELVALNMGDLEWSEKGVIIHVRRSKTDQEGQGASVAIPYMSGNTCPVVALAKWIGRLGRAQRSPDKPLFRAVGNGGNNKWYMPGRDKRLGDRMVSVIVKKYAQLAGLAGNYSAHSLRRGLATEAGARQIPERIIARHTRHRSLAVLREYIDAGNIWDENPLSVIYTTTTSDAPSPFED